MLLTGCDSAPRPPQATIENVYVQTLTCPVCTPAVTAQVQVGGDFAGMQLTIEGATSTPDTLTLPIDPVAASAWTTDMPKTVYDFHGVDDPTFDVVLRDANAELLDRHAVDVDEGRRVDEVRVHYREPRGR